jgi:hypothetical protein
MRQKSGMYNEFGPGNEEGRGYVKDTGIDKKLVLKHVFKLHGANLWAGSRQRCFPSMVKSFLTTR